MANFALCFAADTIKLLRNDPRVEDLYDREAALDALPDFFGGRNTTHGFDFRRGRRGRRGRGDRRGHRGRGGLSGTLVQNDF